MSKYLSYCIVSCVLIVVMYKPFYLLTGIVFSVFYIISAIFLCGKFARHDQNGSNIDILKGVVDIFSAFKIFFFY